MFTHTTANLYDTYIITTELLSMRQQNIIGGTWKMIIDMIVGQ